MAQLVQEWQPGSEPGHSGSRVHTLGHCLHCSIPLTQQTPSHRLVPHLSQCTWSPHSGGETLTGFNLCALLCPPYSTPTPDPRPCFCKYLYALMRPLLLPCLITSWLAFKTSSAFPKANWSFQVIPADSASHLRVHSTVLTLPNCIATSWKASHCSLLQMLTAHTFILQ